MLEAEDSSVIDLLYRAASLVGAGLTVYFFTRCWDQVNFTSIGFQTKGRVCDFLAGSILAASMIFVGFAVLWMFDSIAIKAIELNYTYLFVSFLSFSAVAIMEEMVCRGYILNNLMQVTNKYAALIFSSLVFAFLHLLNPHASFIPILNIFLAGIFLGISYLYTRNLWFPIGLHLFWNFMQGPILGFNVSGTNSENSLLQLDYPREDIFNGGAFGFEGSILCTLFCSVGAIAVGYYYSRKEKNSQQ